MRADELGGGACTPADWAITFEGVRTTLQQIDFFGGKCSQRRGEGGLGTKGFSDTGTQAPKAMIPTSVWTFTASIVTRAFHNNSVLDVLGGGRLGPEQPSANVSPAFRQSPDQNPGEVHQQRGREGGATRNDVVGGCIVCHF